MWREMESIAWFVEVWCRVLSIWVLALVLRPVATLLSSSMVGLVVVVWVTDSSRYLFREKTFLA